LFRKPAIPFSESDATCAINADRDESFFSMPLALTVLWY
jgi:hypothetical protein